ncbi:MAG TPA: hypothetical protein VHG35_02255, partial [Gemmatimonadales bacterium]|nr:hypothetical protein [Gemmatimonadales bacterium]
LNGYRDMPVLVKPVRFADLYGTLVTLVGPPAPGCRSPVGRQRQPVEPAADLRTSAVARPHRVTRGNLPAGHRPA